MVAYGYSRVTQRGWASEVMGWSGVVVRGWGGFWEQVQVKRNMVCPSSPQGGAGWWSPQKIQKKGGSTSAVPALAPGGEPKGTAAGDPVLGNFFALVE